MAAFGVGFSLPLGAILFGVSFGKAFIKAQKAEAIIRNVAGVLLVCAGSICWQRSLKKTQYKKEIRQWKPS